MLKKVMLPILILSIVIQLLVPVGMIAYGNKAEDDLQKYGKEFKFPAQVYSVENGNVNFSIKESSVFYGNDRYGIIKETSGYAYFDETTTTKPKGTDYIRLNEENRKEIDTFSVECRYSYRSITEKSAYLVVKVYNGDIEVMDLYMDDIPAQEWVNTNL